MKKSFIAILIILVSMFLVVGGVSLLSNGNQHPLPSGTMADKVLVEKKARRLTLLKNGKSLKSYRIALGSNPNGKKLEEGDGRTPEGTYTIDQRKVRSSYHRALHVSYPDPDDAAQAKARGVSPGGDIMIHGLPDCIGFLGKLHRYYDWTAGCVAVTNPEIEEIWRVVPNGTVLEIRP